MLMFLGLLVCFGVVGALGVGGAVGARLLSFILSGSCLKVLMFC